MDIFTQILVSLVGALIASTGFWAFLQRKTEQNSASAQMLMGLGHDRIMSLGMDCIRKGYVTRSEYENLHKYLYTPYKGLNGNGSARKVMEEVSKLPIRYSEEDIYVKRD